MTRESTIEKNARHAIEKAGGWMLKFVSPGLRGVPDDLCLWTCQADFLEFKATGEEPTESQRHVHSRLAELGFRVYVINSMEAVREYIWMRTKQ